MLTPNNLNIVIVGIGGIGGHLTDLLIRYICHLPDIEIPILLVDGDSIENKNIARQTFDIDSVGQNKATIKSIEICDLYKNKVLIDCSTDYIDKNNVCDVIGNNTIVLMGVDNRATRLIISQHCQTLNDVILISGGNEYDDGAVLFYRREDGEDKVPPIETHHDEIKNPADKNPADIGCDELIASNSSPQLIFANATASLIMCWGVYNYLLYILKGEELNDLTEIHFDVKGMDIRQFCFM